MAKVKKICKTLLGIALCTGCLNISAYAAEDTAIPTLIGQTANIQEAMHKNDEYVSNNIDALFEKKIRATEDIWGVTQILEPINGSSEDVGYGAITFTVQDEDILTKKQNRNSIPLHAKTVVTYVLPLDSEVFSTSDPKHKYDFDYDKYKTVKAYSTFYYDRKTIDRNDYYLLISISGGVDILDSVQVINQEVFYGQSGPTPPGTDGFQEPKGTYRPLNTTWNVDTGFVYYIKGVGNLSLNTVYSMTIRRLSNSSQWSLKLENGFTL